QADSRPEVSGNAPAAPIVSTRVQPPSPGNRGNTAGTRTDGTSTGTDDAETALVPPAADTVKKPVSEQSGPAATGLLAESDDPPGEVARLEGHSSMLQRLAVLKDGHHAVTGSVDGTVRFWDLSTGKESGGPLDQGTAVTDVAVSADEQLLLSVGHRGTVHLWDLKSRSKLREMTGHRGEVRAGAFSHDGKIVATGGAERELRIWEVATSKMLLKIPASVGRIQEIEFLPNGRQILCSGDGSSGPVAGLYDTETGKELQQYEGPTDGIHAVTLLEGARQFLAGSVDGSIRLFDVTTGKELQRFSGHTGIVLGIAVLPGTACFLSGDSAATLRLWNLRTGRQIHEFKAETHCTAYLDVTPDGRFAISGFGARPTPSGDDFVPGGDYAVHLWRLPQLAPGTNPEPTLLTDGPPGEVIQLKGHTDTVHALAFYSQGNRLASASADGTVRFWNLTTGRPEGDPLQSGARINTMAISPDEKFLLTGGRNGKVQTWDLNSRTRVSEYSVEGGEAYSVNFASQFNLIASGAENGTVRIRSAEDGEERLKFSASVGRVLEVEFSPYSPLILCSGTGTPVCLY
ncbi:MAG: WD40 repeat domain-containing protein, partial [Planctomycetaceae bacterium]|nr:WD40 repeat domain-containing protein [Planctomycetaceae bacterium]